jgi:UDP-N-acetylmuramoyl-tripeptide--D-alanyl-D-alanine ligase
MHLRPGDLLFIVGDHAAALREGLIESGNDAGRIEIVAEAAAAREQIAGFRGAVFLKGSRRHRLEQALAAEAPREACAC